MKAIMPIILFMIINLANGQLKESGISKAGVLYGEKNAFLLEAPNGWVLDNQAGKSQGLHAVFYPENESWKDAIGIIYSKAAGKDSIIKNIEDYIKSDLESFKIQCPSIYVKYKSEIKLKDKRKAKVYEWLGDKWGNFESTAYINEKYVIVIIVYTCRNEKYYKENYNKFEQVVKSYKFIPESENQE